MTLTIEAEKREILGNKLKDSRQDGKLPAVLYGRKEKSASLFIDSIKFDKIFKEAGESSVITVKTGDGDKSVLIHDVQFSPISGKPVHVDFYAIEKDKKVEVDISLVFVGESPAVRELGGILVKVLHEIKVEALPADLPSELEVDISKLKDFESQIHVKDLIVPATVTILNESDEVIALVETAREEEPEEETTPDLSSIEVEKKGKQEEESTETTTDTSE